MLSNYFLRSDAVKYLGEASDAVIEETLACYGRNRVFTGNMEFTIVSCDGRRHRKILLRADWYSCETFDDAGRERFQDAWYGRIRKVQVCLLHLPSGPQERELLNTDWATSIQISVVGEFYKSAGIERCFSNDTIREVAVFVHSIGIFEYKVPEACGKRTYFSDSSCQVLGLPDEHELSPDGINRSLRWSHNGDSRPCDQLDGAGST